MSEPIYPNQNQNPQAAQPATGSQPGITQQPAAQGQPAYAPSRMSQAAAQAAPQAAAASTYRQATAANAAAHQQAGNQTRGFQSAVTPMQPSAATAQAATKQTGGWLKPLVSGAIGALIAMLITLAVLSMGAPTPGDTSTTDTTVIGGSGDSTIAVSGEDVTLPEVVAAKTLPSVVCIYVYTEQSTYGWFGQEEAGEQMSGLGSGVILSEDGYIITNYHVIEGESSLKVSMNGGQYDATVVGSDPSSDLAVVKVEGAEGLTPIEIGSSADLVVGEWVMTVGAPYGMEQSVGSGIVSAVSRSSASLLDTESGAVYANMIQTDAPINPGNSGGALVDKNGKLVGINTLTASYSGSNSGVGFAIPSDYAVSIANQIIKGETPSHAQLGVSLVSVDAATAQRYNLPVDHGAYVAASYAGAAEAGIKEGDIITKIGNKNVTSASDIMLEVRSHNPGDTVTVEVNRDGKTETMEVTLTSDADNNVGNVGGNAGGNSGSNGNR